MIGKVAFLFVAVLLSLPTSVKADQSDKRLDSLFNTLGQAQDAYVLRDLERQIWSIWGALEDEKVKKEFDAGVQAMNQGRMILALRWFNRVVKKAPEFSEAWNKRATVFYMLGKLDQSISDIERTIDLEPRHFGAFSGLGLIYMKMGNNEAALEAFERVLVIHPHFGDVRDMAAELREKIKGKLI